MILAILACKIREASNIISLFNWIKLCSSLPRVEQKLSRRREREVCVRVLNRNWADAERERGVCVRVLNRNWADAEREREREREVCVCARAEQKLSRCREREREVCVCARAEQKLSRCREREVCVCARAEQKLSRCREREKGVCACWTETEQTRRERERCVCLCWESKTSRGSTGDSLRLNKVWALFFRGEKSRKGSAMLISWQHCAFPFLQLRIGPWVKPKIRAALITC